MEQLVYTVTRDGGAAALSSTGYLRLLETRLAKFAELAESLTSCRTVFIQSNVDALMRCIEVQAAHCNEILRIEQALEPYAKLTDFLSPAEQERAAELLRRAAGLKRDIQQLNRIYASLVRKAAHNNAVLRNLYATALVYADPRQNHGASCGKVEV
ncbi:MAG TPA: hypothetical protein VFB79_17745 [Candidatus Angelobacter sp.]|nr:hypothetical protein [Candidatus Angelobacter sp.]